MKKAAVSVVAFLALAGVVGFLAKGGFSGSPTNGGGGGGGGGGGASVVGAGAVPAGVPAGEGLSSAPAANGGGGIETLGQLPAISACSRVSRPSSTACVPTYAMAASRIAPLNKPRIVPKT